MKKTSEITVFTDGACLGNPGPGGWAYTIVLPSEEVRELAGFEAATTNNRMELRAVVESLKVIQNENEKALIYLDSQYVISGATQWIFAWKNRDWKTKEGKNVEHTELWKELAELLYSMKGRVAFKKVPGHQGIPGNERVDQLASAMAARKDPDLFRGFLKDYKYPVLEGLDFVIEKKGDPFYLSFVDGIAKTHKTWSECEAAVKGRKGVKFKKVFSQGEADRLIKEWNKA